VIDADGKPRANAIVNCRPHRYVMGHTISSIEPSFNVTTDQDGRFQSPRLPVGFASFLVTLPERQVAYASVPTQPQGSLALPKPIQLQNDIPVHGVIRDEAGHPVAGVAVKANTVYTATSDDDGRFTLRGFGPDPRFQLQMGKQGHVFINWAVKFGADGVRHQEVGVENAAQVVSKELEVLMPHVAWIDGRVIDADTGAAVKLDKVTLCTFERRPNGEVVVGSCRVSRFEQPEDGHFRVPYSQPDEYHLAVTAEGYHDGEAFTPPVESLQPIDGIVVKLKQKAAGTAPSVPTQTLSGTVTRDGQPVKSGWAAIWGPGRPRDQVNAYVLRGRTAGANGFAFASAPIRDGAYQFSLPAQPAGGYLMIEEPGQAPTLVGPLVIKSGVNKTVDVACVAGGTVRGNVARVPEGWQGQLWAIAFSRAGVRAEARVGADGTFLFEQLPPGTYGLKVGLDAYQDVEVPGHGSLVGLPAEAFETPADPWKRAVKVKVTSGQTSENVVLELPE
jgi:hypothetical protein